MTTTDTDAARERIGRAGQLLAAAEELALRAWRADPASPWLLHANAIRAAREALAHFALPLPPGPALPGDAHPAEPADPADPADLARRAREELNAIPDGQVPLGLGVPLVYLANALRDLEAPR